MEGKVVAGGKKGRRGKEADLGLGARSVLILSNKDQKRYHGSVAFHPYRSSIIQII